MENLNITKRQKIRIHTQIIEMSNVGWALKFKNYRFYNMI